MQFKHPEILFALFLLIIPIVIHLFNFQKYQKEPFTNVQFLKNIQYQTRKSEQLKRLLLLITRLLIFTNLIIAFAQPFWPNKTANKNIETTIYLDNSFSMQAEGESGSLLKNNIQKLIKATQNSKEKFNLITNDKTFHDLDAKRLKKNLLQLNYSSKKPSLNALILKFNSAKHSKSNTLYKNILISDFQNINMKNKTIFTNVNSTNILIKTVPRSNQNFYIDSVYINKKTIDQILVNVIIKSNLNATDKIAISLFNSDKLSGKATCKFNHTTSEKVQFSIPNTPNFLGKLVIDNDALSFDNSFYFSINKPKKIDVLSIGNNASFLSKIYKDTEFNYHNYSLANLDYNQLQNQQVILLNELVKINKDLIFFLNKYISKGGILIIIPSENIDIKSYNTLLKQLKIGSVQQKIENEQLITSINFKHPLLTKVFEKKVKNFDYPKTKISYKTTFKNQLPILKYDSNRAFISSIRQNNTTFYWFSSPLNSKVSNFMKSPLIVPVFYNIATRKLNTTNLFNSINSNNHVAINFNLSKNEVLSVKNNNNHFIPLQKSYNKMVELNFQNQNQKSGFYQILTKEKLISTLAFNYNRDESKLKYLDLEKTFLNDKNVTFSNSITSVFNKLNQDQKIKSLFIWFLALAILFLLIEIWILKYFKQ